MTRFKGNATAGDHLNQNLHHAQGQHRFSSRDAPGRARHKAPPTDSQHDSPFFPNLYGNKIPDHPGRVWVADFTYIRVSTGFRFLAVILDACSRKVVGYALSKRLDTPLALAALRTAVANRARLAGCILHSDRGSQYASQTYRDELKAAGLQGSMSSVGNPYHNAQA